MSDGYCQCGCGQRTNLMTYNEPKRGYVKGEPFRYILGHGRRKGGPEYQVDDETGCWVWRLAKTSAGYGEMRLGGGRYAYAHRVYYERAKGAIPDKFVIDHLCGNPSCVNPDHLEAVTNAENCRRGRRARLTQVDADSIRESSASPAELALAHGVSQGHIRSIRHGNRWAAA